MTRVDPGAGSRPPAASLRSARPAREREEPLRRDRDLEATPAVLEEQPEPVVVVTLHGVQDRVVDRLERLRRRRRHLEVLEPEQADDVAGLELLEPDAEQDRVLRPLRLLHPEPQP